MIRNTAFEFLRQHKEVDQSTEELVLKRLRGRLNQEELLNVFENGISGQYGKVYSITPDCLMNWIDQYDKEKNSSRNYLSSPLAPVTMNINEVWDWEKEANKCYHAFLGGVSADYFHQGVYDEMVLSDKIKPNSYLKYSDGCDYMDEKKIADAKRKVLADVFSAYKKHGFQTVFFIR